MVPAGVTRELNRRACRVPQHTYQKKPHNVIAGEFALVGQTDWAVLCLVGGVSNGAADKPAEIAATGGGAFVQALGGGRSGSSRDIDHQGEGAARRDLRQFILATNTRLFGQCLKISVEHGYAANHRNRGERTGCRNGATFVSMARNSVVVRGRLRHRWRASAG